MSIRSEEDSSPFRRKLSFSPNKNSIRLSLCLILIQVDTFISNNKMCFDYGKEEASSKNK